MQQVPSTTSTVLALTGKPLHVETCSKCPPNPSVLPHEAGRLIRPDVKTVTKHTKWRQCHTWESAHSPFLLGMLALFLLISRSSLPQTCWISDVTQLQSNVD